MRGRRRVRDERGSAVVELVWLGILLLVPIIWIVTSVFEVQRGAFAVSGAARSAARAFALAPDDATGTRAAEAAARLALRDQGIDDAPLEVAVTCTTAGRIGGCHASGSVITVTVRSRVDLPGTPDPLGDQQPSFALEAAHTVPIGQYQEAAP